MYCSEVSPGVWEGFFEIDGRVYYWKQNQNVHRAYDILTDQRIEAHYSIEWWEV